MLVNLFTMICEPALYSLAFRGGGVGVVITRFKPETGFSGYVTALNRLSPSLFFTAIVNAMSCCITRSQKVLFHIDIWGVRIFLSSAVVVSWYG